MTPVLPIPARRPALTDETSPLHIWASLTTESQQRAVRLMAQLACTLATVPVAPAHTEPSHVHPTHHVQTPA